MTDGSIAAVTERDGAVVVTPNGDIDLSRSPELRVILRGVQAKKPDLVVIDLSGVTYMDSSGLATLVESMRAAKTGGGRLILADMTPRVRDIFEIAHLDQFFSIVESVDAAIAG